MWDCSCSSPWSRYLAAGLPSQIEGRWLARFGCEFKGSILKKALPHATTMIRMDHTHVLATFHRYRRDAPAHVKQALFNMICTALEVPAQLEEEIFYPGMRAAAASDNAIVEKSLPEHEEMKGLIRKLRGMHRAIDALYDDTLIELMRGVLHHVADEETTLLPDAERALGEGVEDLGLQMTRRRLELTVPRSARSLSMPFAGFQRPQCCLPHARLWPLHTWSSGRWVANRLRRVIFVAARGWRVHPVDKRTSVRFRGLGPTRETTSTLVRATTLQNPANTRRRHKKSACTDRRARNWETGRSDTRGSPRASTSRLSARQDSLR